MNDLLGKLVMYNRYFRREMYIYEIYFMNLSFSLMFSIVCFVTDVCIFLGREANRLCIGARKSANNICVIMNVLSLVFTKFTHPYGFI